MKILSIHGISILALMVCFAVPVLVDARTAAAQGETPRGPDLHDAGLVSGRAGDKEEVQATVPQGHLLAAHHLEFRLVGTVVADDPGRSLAVIENASTGEQRGCRVGDQVGKILIKEILYGKVVIQTSSGYAVLPVTSRGAIHAFIVPPDETQSLTAHVDKQELDAVLPDYTNLISEIRMRPRFKGGRPEGFVIYNIAPESLLGRMGLKDGDVIVGVNDTSFSTTQPVVEFYEALKAGRTVSFKVERDEGTKDLRIEFTE